VRVKRARVQVSIEDELLLWQVLILMMLIATMIAGLVMVFWKGGNW
jgi:hypothetical protein